METFKPNDIKIGDYVAYSDKSDEVSFGTISKIEHGNFYLDNGEKVYACQLYALYTEMDPDKKIWKKDVKQGYIIDSLERENIRENIGKRIQQLKDRSL